jgi:hypothetical protein
MLGSTVVQRAALAVLAVMLALATTAADGALLTAIPYTENSKKVPVEGAHGDTNGAAVSMSADGSTAAVGAPGWYATSRVGKVYVYTNSANGWNQQGGALLPQDGGLTSRVVFGSSVALSGNGDLLAVGSPHMGAYWLFARSNGAWAQQGNMVVLPSTYQCGAGVQFSKDGKTLAVLCAVYGGTPLFAVLRLVNNQWLQDAGDFTPTGAGPVVTVASPDFAMSADTNTIVVSSAYVQRGANYGDGAFWVFRRSNNAWALDGTEYTDSNLINFGINMAASADVSKVVIGSLGNVEFYALNGAAYVSKQIIYAPAGWSTWGGNGLAMSVDSARLFIADTGADTYGAIFMFQANPSTGLYEMVPGNLTVTDFIVTVNNANGFGAQIALSDDSTKLVTGAYADGDYVGEFGLSFMTRMSIG